MITPDGIAASWWRTGRGDQNRQCISGHCILQEAQQVSSSFPSHLGQSKAIAPAFEWVLRCSNDPITAAVLGRGEPGHRAAPGPACQVGHAEQSPEEVCGSAAPYQASRAGHSGGAAFEIRLTVLLDPANANKIPDPRLMVPCSSLCLFPDATGWGGGQAGRGYGAVVEVNSELILTYGPWPEDWSSPARDSMITLEGIAALAGLVMVCPLVAGQSVVIKTDNKSLAMAYSKGHSRSELASSVILALYRLARARAISLAIEWTPRCSSDFTIAADSLSRGLVDQAISRLPALPARWGTRSKTLEKFISDPLPTRLLGQAIATELPCETLTWSLESSEDLWSLM